MSGPLIVSCIGSSDPLIREYVHDFGLYAINLAMLEETLRRHLAHRDMLRAQWRGAGVDRGIRVAKLRKIQDKFSFSTMGSLLREYRRGGGAPALIALIEPTVQARNLILHNHLQLSEDGMIGTARVQEVRSTLHALSGQARAAGHAVQVADVELFAKIIARLKDEGVPTDGLGPPLEHLLLWHDLLLRRLEGK